MAATWKKLRNGEWGAKVSAIAEVAEVIRVTARSGATKDVQVREVLWSGTDRAGGWLSIVAVAPVGTVERPKENVREMERGIERAQYRRRIAKYTGERTPW